MSLQSQFYVSNVSRVTSTKKSIILHTHEKLFSVIRSEIISDRYEGEKTSKQKNTNDFPTGFNIA